MTEENELLLKALCELLPYGVKCLTFDGQVAITGKLCSFSEFTDGSILFGLTDKIYDAPDKYYQPQAMFKYETIKPYLRPLTSMSEEEQKEFVQFHCVTLCPVVIDEMLTLNNESNMFDWLNTHHFDYRGLIEKGLALEAPEDMYETKTE